MPSRVRKVTPNKDAIKKHVELPECEVKEGEVWYPPDEFLVYAHDLMIERYGYWSGFELGLEPYHLIVAEMKKAEGIYRKAAILLRGIVTTRIFQDGHYRTGFEVTKAFLEMNNAQMKENVEVNIIKFIKGIRKYSVDDVECWLRNGSL